MRANRGGGLFRSTFALYAQFKAHYEIGYLSGRFGHDGLEWNNMVCDVGFCPD